MWSAIGLIIFLPLAFAFDIAMIAGGMAVVLFCLAIGSWGEIALAIFALMRES